MLRALKRSPKSVSQKGGKSMSAKVRASAPETFQSSLKLNTSQSEYSKGSNRYQKLFFLCSNVGSLKYSIGMPLFLFPSNITSSNYRAPCMQKTCLRAAHFNLSMRWSPERQT